MMDTLGSVAPAGCGTIESDQRIEAFERLRFLAECGRCGVLVADPGMGKSELFAHLATDLRRGGQPVSEIDLLGVGGEELPSLAASRLGLGLSPGEDPRRVWSLLQDFAEAGRLTGTCQLFLLDHADRGDESLAGPVERLIGTFAGSAFLFATRPQAPRDLRRLLAERAWLQVGLDPLRQREIARVVSRDSARGEPAARFNPEGLQTLASLSHGNLGRIRQLSELACLAAVIEDRNEIDGELVRSVACEMTAPLR